MRIALFALVVAASAQDWPSFRGPTASGVADGQNLPVGWDAQQRVGVLWKTEVRGFRYQSLLSAIRLRIAVLSEWAVARASLPNRWLAHGRRQLHRYLLRLANEESMRNRQHEGLLSVEVGQSDHTTSPLQEPECLPMPTEFLLQDVPETAAHVGQLLGPLLILLLCSLEIRFFPGQFDGYVNVTQPLYLGFQHAAEKNAVSHLGQEVRALVNQRHPLKKLRQGSFGGRLGDRFARR
jgi:hypothetical protein